MKSLTRLFAVEKLLDSDNPPGLAGSLVSSDQASTESIYPLGEGSQRLAEVYTPTDPHSCHP